MHHYYQYLHFTLCSPASALEGETPHTCRARNAFTQPHLTLLCCPGQGMFPSQHRAALQSTWSIPCSLCLICSKQGPGNSSGMCVWSDNTKCCWFLLPALTLGTVAYQWCDLRHLTAKLQSSCGVTAAQSYLSFFLPRITNVFLEKVKGKTPVQEQSLLLLTFHSLPNHGSVLLFSFFPSDSDSVFTTFSR